MAGCFDRDENGDTQETAGSLVKMPHFLTPVLLSTLSLSQDTQPPAPAAIHPSLPTPHPPTFHLRAPQCAAAPWQSRNPKWAIYGPSFRVACIL